jgi:hypothetical protein
MSYVVHFAPLHLNESKKKQTKLRAIAA